MVGAQVAKAALRSGASVAAESASKAALDAASKAAAGSATKAVIGTASKAVAGVGAVAGAAVEIGFMSHDIHKAVKEKENNQITQRQFRRCCRKTSW